MIEVFFFHLVFIKGLHRHPATSSHKTYCITLSIEFLMFTRTKRYFPTISYYPALKQAFDKYVMNEQQFLSIHIKTKIKIDQTSYKNMYRSSYNFKCHSPDFSCLISNKYTFLSLASLLVSRNWFYSSSIIEFHKYSLPQA